MRTFDYLLITVAMTTAVATWAAEPAKAAKAPPKPKPTYLTPAEGGQDYVDQGEYANTWGGAQVIALGDDRFRLVVYPGGLPGSGWDQSAKTEVDGKRDGNAIVFNPAPNGFKHRLAQGELTTTTPAGETYTMKKIERKSPTLGAAAPAGAMVLFSDANADAWNGGHMDARNLLAAGTTSKRSFTNFTVHLEFLLPFKPLGRGQDRGNSGVYLQDRYELQVLDSFGLRGEDNECGGFYSLAKPLLNMCYPPLTWQTYDIDFQTARFDAEGKKIKNAVVTVKHNGVVIHDKLELKNATPGGQKESPKGGPLQLQGHGNPVFYRNIWVVEN